MGTPPVERKMAPLDRSSEKEWGEVWGSSYEHNETLSPTYSLNNYDVVID